jgi:hypothetical protein
MVSGRMAPAGSSAVVAGGAGVGAFERLKQAAERQEPEALFRLGTLLFEGRLLRQRPALAADLMRRAADRSHAAAQNAYGFMLQHGLGIAADAGAAARWYARAAAAGDAEAQNNLGWLYQQGRGVERSPDQAVHWYTRAVAAGSGVAAWHLGRLCESADAHAAGPELVAALAWYAKAAAAGEAMAQYRLGQALLEGRGVVPDPAAGRALITAARAPPLCCTYSSAFVNVTPEPELAALRPPAPPLDAAADATAPPAIVLDFVPDATDARSARLHFADVWDRIRAGFALPGLELPEVAVAAAWYAARPELASAIFARSRQYLFHIVDELERRRMPTELALLPFVESGFDPFALSSAQASGLWQFIPGTGLRFNLQQNDVFDARRDIVASTAAALDYLSALHTQFGDWQLALAAYNWGENQVARAIERNRAKGLPADFASLPLPPETRNYVPRLMAVREMVLSPSAFQVTLPAVANLQYFTSVARPAGVDLAQAARFADMKFEEFKALNPAHNYEIVNASASLPLLLPLDRAQGYEQRLGEFMQKEAARQKPKPAKPGRRANRKM